jgi:hypothetical protein
VPFSVLVVVVFELRVTFELPVGLREVVRVKDEPLIETTGPTTEPETGVVAPTATAQTTAVAADTVRIAATLLPLLFCAISTSFPEVARGSVAVVANDYRSRLKRH